MRVNAKPLSVNEAWKGKRFKTDKYFFYEKELLFKLKHMTIPEGKLILLVKLGLSSKNADWDNPIKPFQDILQKKYGFKDNRVYMGVVEKVDVKKGCEFIDFEIIKYEDARKNTLQVFSFLTTN